MKAFATAACLTLSLVAISACNKKPADGDASVAPASAPAADPLAALGNGPGLKAGLWETTVHVGNAPGGITTKMCLDDELSKKFQDMGTSNTGDMTCTPSSASRNGNVIDITTVCKDPDMTLNNKMHMEIAGDTYHQVVEQSYTPEVMKPIISTIDGKYLGACPADLKPGQLDIGGGTKIDMKTHKMVKN